MSSSVFMITGASRGLGRYFAQEAVRRGCKVVVSARGLEDAEKTVASLNADVNTALAVEVDVTREDSARHGIEIALEQFGRIDGLINNAGYGLLGAIEEVDADELTKLLDTNVIGAQRMMRLVLPIMREQQSGTVVNISSLGGFASSPGWGAYNASKFALEGLSEALAIEVAPHGISVIIVEPGSFRTEFLSERSMRRTIRHLDAYSDTAGQMRERVKRITGSQAGDPNLAAKVVFDAIFSKTPPERLVLGSDAITRVERKLQKVRDDIDAWRDQTSEMGFSQ